MSAPDLSIVIVNYGSGRLAKACVDSIRRDPPQCAYEVIVVDNNSPDDSQELLATEVPDTIFLPQTENLGYARGVNVGIRRTRGNFVLILNPDIIVLRGAIDTLLDFARAHPRAAVVAGRLVNPNGSTQDSFARFYTPFTILARRTPLGLVPPGTRHLAWVQMRQYGRETPRPVDWVLGACMLVRSDALENVGLMDERFFMYFEDMDWCRRFWHAGWEVWYEPAARFSHYYKRESALAGGFAALFQPLTRIHIASGFKYFWKYRRQGAVPARRAP